MRKQIVRFAIVLLVLWILCTLSVVAAPPGIDRSCRLSLQYAHDGEALNGAEVSVYRVAEACVDGTFQKVAPFDTYAVSIHDIITPDAWKTLAVTLEGYVVDDGVIPTETNLTNAEGNVVFTDLSTGLYLVRGVTVSTENGIVTFDSFMVYLPALQGEQYLYEVEATPKGSFCSSSPKEVTYRVLKLWKDAGYTEARSAAVTVALYEDGNPRDTVTLSAENNWTHTWTDSDGAGVWTVVEKNVPDGYSVSVAVNDTVFTLTNTYTKTHTDTPVVKPPQTGDTAPLMLYVILMCLSGLVLVILALVSRRGEQDEKTK